MTDEEMAEEWVKDNCCDLCVCQDECEIGCIHCGVKDGFLAGLKARLQWHDLRKDKNDLPEKESEFESKLVYISYSDGDTDFAYYEFPNKVWYRLFGEEPTISPIAWCEIPTFDKE